MSLSRYRAWDKENDRMIYPSNNDVYFNLTDDGISIEGLALEPFDDVFPHLDAVLMQSTGLKDKNGVEIFEGDIVIHTQKSINYGDVYHNDYAEVFQQQNGAYRIRGKHIYEMDAFCNRKRLEVVGNIFENAELLEHDSFMTEK